MYDPETTDLPVLDNFSGAEGLVRLSQRLMDWYDAPISDQEIADVLGEDLIPAFRYAQQKLDGKVRKVTLEPAFCHSADVAFRAVELGYPKVVVASCFLHDVVEDVCKSIEDMPAALNDLARTFSPEVLHAVSLVTNRYQLIFKRMVPKVDARVGMDSRGVQAYRAALDVVWYELPADTIALFEEDFQRLGVYLDTEIDLTEAIKIAKRDRKFTLGNFLERRLYDLYVDDLVAHAANTALQTEGHEQVTALIVKFMDLIDNVRTSEVSNRLSLYKLVSKAESVLDRVQTGFLDLVPGDLAARTTIPTVHRIVQVRLVDQFKLRRRAVADNFSETRFASLVHFLAEHANRLAEKYNVPKERVPVIGQLEDQVRAWNSARAGRGW